MFLWCTILSINVLSSLIDKALVTEMKARLACNGTCSHTVHDFHFRYPTVSKLKLGTVYHDVALTIRHVLAQFRPSYRTAPNVPRAVVATAPSDLHRLLELSSCLIFVRSYISFIEP